MLLSDRQYNKSLHFQPCFGKAVRSPPVAEKPLPLIEMPVEESGLLLSYSQSGKKRYLYNMSPQALE